MEKAGGRRAIQRRRGQKVALGEREKRRLVQLGACLLLFLAVFCAKGLDRLETLRDDLSRTLQANVDLEAVLMDLSGAVAGGQPVEKTLNRMWGGLLHPKEEKEAPAAWREGPLYLSARRELGRQTGGAPHLLEGFGQEEALPDPMADSGARAAPEPGSEQTEEAEPAVVYVDYSGPALPDNTTMDKYALGLSETVSPVESRITSGFGWRDHPIEGGEKFHRGVDLKAGEGTTVQAFAAGTVDYIGESDIYGLYLQLRHGNGVTSFYAHCSKLCVQQGQAVEAGEKVAESGATGEVTGPHLHFELQKDGVRLDPAHYIQTEP